MDSLEHDHYKLSKMFMSTIGIWPYDNSTAFVRVKRLLSTVTIVCSAVILLAGYFLHRTKCKEQTVVNSLVYGQLATLIATKYWSYWNSMRDIRSIIELMRDDWKLLRNGDEQRIVLQHADRGKFINLIFSSAILLAMFSNMYLSFVKTQNADVCAPSANLYIPANYLSNDKQNRYIMLLHIQVFVLLSFCTILGTELTSIVFVYHVSGLFQVVRFTIKQDPFAMYSYRMRHVFTDKTLCCSNTTMDETLRERLVNVVKIHTRTLHFCKCLSDTLGPMYFRMLLFGVTYISVHLLRMADIKVRSNDLQLMTIQVCVIIVCFVYVFFANYMGQTIMDSSAKLLNEAYDTRWYAAPLKAQKLLLFIMQHCVKTYNFSIGGIFMPSSEGFATISRMSYSYFTVIRSNQS